MAGIKGKSYTADFKVKVIVKAEEAVNRAGGVRVGDQRIVHSQMEKGGKGAGENESTKTRASWAQREMARVEEIPRRERIKASTVTIQIKAKLLANEGGIPDFKVDFIWISKFLKRNDLSMGMGTTDHDND